MECCDQAHLLKPSRGRRLLHKTFQQATGNLEAWRPMPIVFDGPGLEQFVHHAPLRDGQSEKTVLGQPVTSMQPLVIHR